MEEIKTQFTQRKSTGRGNESRPVDYYFLIIWGDVAPELKGPYGSYEAVAAQARIFVRIEDPGRQHGIFWLENYEGIMSVHAWSGGQTESWLDT